MSRETVGHWSNRLWSAKESIGHYIQRSGFARDTEFLNCAGIDQVNSQLWGHFQPRRFLNLSVAAANPMTANPIIQRMSQRSS